MYAYPKGSSWSPKEDSKVHKLIFVNGQQVGIVWENSGSSMSDFVCWWALQVGAKPQQYKHGCSDYKTLPAAMDAARKIIRRDLTAAYRLAQAGFSLGLR